MAANHPTKFIVYVDESGDHGLANIDPNYPVFVLVFCVFRQTAYTTQASPAVQRLKFKWWGHDIVVLHERDIRKKLKPFSMLKDPALNNAFLADVNGMMADMPVTFIASVIDKQKHLDTYGPWANNPYNLGLAFCLERLHWLMRENGAAFEATRVVFERRGAAEDRDLELEFRRVCDGHNALEHGKGLALPFEIVFADKRVNSSGLQIADLVGRPIGRHVMDPAAPSRAWDVIEPKFRRREGRIEGAGLKIFPS